LSPTAVDADAVALKSPPGEAQSVPEKKRWIQVVSLSSEGR